MQPPPSDPRQTQSVQVRLPLARPRWTYIFLVLNGVLFAAMLVVGLAQSSNLQNGFRILGRVLQGDSNLLVAFGANAADLVDAGQYWRLISANFLHVGIAHLLINGYSLYVLGMQTEAVYGPRRFVTIYILSGVSGAIFSYLFTHGLSAGASTSLFGLFAALVVFFYKQRKLLASSSQQLIRLGVTLAVNIYLGLTPGSHIDNYGHLGGFVGGLILAWFLCPRYERTNPFTGVFAPAIRPENKPELSNEDITDTNSLVRQKWMVGAFVVGLIALITLGTFWYR